MTSRHDGGPGRNARQAWATTVIAVLALGLTDCGSSVAAPTTTSGVTTSASAAVPTFYSPPSPLPALTM